jgi:hypothetical protein
MKVPIAAIAVVVPRRRSPRPRTPQPGAASRDLPVCCRQASGRPEFQQT